MTTFTEDDIAKLKFRPVTFIDMASGGFMRSYVSEDYPFLRATIRRVPKGRVTTTTYWVGEVECHDRHATAKALTNHVRDLEWDAAAPKEARAG